MQPSTPYTHAEIFKWTLAADAVAPCFVEDVFKLEENEKHSALSKFDRSNIAHCAQPAISSGLEVCPVGR